MPIVSASRDHVRDPNRGVGEARVPEKGLPHVSRIPFASYLGRTILLATDLSNKSGRVHGRAIELAEEAGAHLVIIAIIPPRARRGPNFGKRLDALVRRARRRGVDAEGWILVGDPAEMILSVASAVRADSIVIGRDQWFGLATRGSICGHVLVHATCPVLVAPAWLRT